MAVFDACFRNQDFVSYGGIGCFRHPCADAGHVGNEGDGKIGVLIAVREHVGHVASFV